VPNLSPSDYSLLREIGYTRTFDKNEIIQNDAVKIHDLPIVSKGSIRVMQQDEEGREMFLYHIQPGETCIMSFLGGLHNEKSKISAVAEEESEVILIPITKMSEVIAKLPTWFEYIFNVYYQRFDELLNVVNELTFKKMDERLLHYLQKKKAAIGSYELSLTHEEIANQMGTSRVVISRLLKKLEQEGLIELSRNQITLL
jgi:CRP/FNR family transcriptional regulator